MSGRDERTHNRTENEADPVELTPDTTEADLARLSIAARGSQRRRRTLERLAGICTDSGVSVAVQFESDQAYCRPAADEETDDYVIVLPEQKYAQTVTEMSPRRWDKRVQIAFLFHELGHVHYSDFERFQDRQETLDPRWRPLFRAVYNAAEDGVVETQMANAFDVREDFLVLNETLARLETARHEEFVRLFADADHVDVDPDAPMAELPMTYTVFEALSIGILDRGFGDSGRFREIIDEHTDRRVVRDGRRDVLEAIRPRMDRYVADMLSEPDGSRRVDLAEAFFEDVRSELADLPDSHLHRGETTGLRPEDAAAGAVSDPETADLLPDAVTAARHVQDRSEADVVVEVPAERPDTGRGSTRDGRTRGAPPSEVTERTIRRAEESIDEHPVRGRQGRSAKEREAARLLSAVESDDTGLARIGVVEVDEGTVDRTRWEAARRAAAKLSSDFAGQLRRERRTDRTGGFRSGRLDPHRVVSVVQGRNRVFTRRDDGGDKDYSCLIVLDRSGSMGGKPIEAAENATAQLVHAFSEVGVDVSVISVWDDCPWLEVPFGGDVRDYGDHVLTGRACGGTPLSDALTLARDRVRTGDGYEPLVIVVTDGVPNDESRYEAELAKCNFGVFGVYVGAEQGVHADLFDRVVYAGLDDVAWSLRTLARTFLRDR